MKWTSRTGTTPSSSVLLLVVAVTASEAVPSQWVRGSTGGGRPAGDRVKSMPGFIGELPSAHYAGYINVNNSTGRNLFYYMVSSEGDPSSDPLVVWLNGGPGCSSFDGWVYEHGPFVFTHDGDGAGIPSHVNPFSWSKAASMLYIDSPSGVGFSYSEEPGDYAVDDTRTAQDLHELVVQFLSERHPELASLPLFIAGESYAGVYVPMLAAEIVRGNAFRRAHSSGLSVNLKGILVGNGVTDPEFDGNALVPFAKGKSLIDSSMHHEIQQACGHNYWNATVGSKCDRALAKMDAALAKLNIYDSLDTCFHNRDAPVITPDAPRRRTRGHGVALPTTSVGRAWPLRANVKMGLVKTWPQLYEGLQGSPPCIDDSIARTYLNRPDVKAALHVKPGVEWQLCTDKLQYTHDVASMIEIHLSLLSQGLEVLIYSGDHDMCVPHTGSEAWTASLKLPAAEPWRPWLFDDSQVAGYVKRSMRMYQGPAGSSLSYATVLGAGHTVPEYKPKQALHMFSAFVDGRPL